MSFDASKSAIVHGFQAFYYEILRQKEKALSLLFTDSSKVVIETETDNGIILEENIEDTNNKVEGTVVAIQKQLISTIKNIINTILNNSHGYHKDIEEIKYIMAALSDEIFLNLRWEGSKVWKFTLIEKQLFQTEIAGNKFFIDLEKTLINLQNEELAFVYLMALSLGFKGKFRGVDESRISWYKDRLFAVCQSKSTGLFFPGRQTLIQSCYNYTNKNVNNSSLPDIRFWSWLTTFVICIYIIISYIVWNNVTDEISILLKKIC